VNDEAKPSRRTYCGGWKRIPGTIVDVTATSAADAKRQIMKMLRNANYDNAQWVDIRVRLGEALTQPHSLDLWGKGSADE
jgi:hypothetical protein